SSDWGFESGADVFGVALRVSGLFLRRAGEKLGKCWPRNGWLVVFSQRFSLKLKFSGLDVRRSLIGKDAACLSADELSISPERGLPRGVDRLVRERFVVGRLPRVGKAQTPVFRSAPRNCTRILRRPGLIESAHVIVGLR